MKTNKNSKTTQIVYEAHCIEHGSAFVVIFKTQETRKSVLKFIGKDLASGWGAECMRVLNSDDYTDINAVYNYDARKTWNGEEYV